MLLKTKTKTKTKKKVTKKSAKKAAKKVTGKVAKKPDKAHQPGHQKMKISGIGENNAEKTRVQESAVNALTKADIVRRNSKNRRIITGAALGKTGRITIKD